jgi:GTPase Era involved in 16S rRNA processing
MPVTPDALAEWVTVAGQRSKDAAFVEVGYPADILEGNVTLVDTPGVNDLNEQRADITYGYVPRADAAIFLLDATQILTASERTFLEQRILRSSRDRLVFVVTKADQLEPEELAEALRFARAHLEPIVPAAPLFAISAKRALAGDAAGGKMQPLLDHLAVSLGL